MKVGLSLTIFQSVSQSVVSQSLCNDLELFSMHKTLALGHYLITRQPFSQSQSFQWILGNIILWIVMKLQLPSLLLAGALVHSRVQYKNITLSSFWMTEWVDMYIMYLGLNKALLLWSLWLEWLSLIYCVRLVFPSFLHCLLLQILKSSWELVAAGQQYRFSGHCWNLLLSK